MMGKTFAAVVVIGLLGVVPAVAEAQQPSLAELSRREAERRKSLKEPAKVVTDEDVATSKGQLTVTASAPLVEQVEGEPTEADAGAADTADAVDPDGATPPAPEGEASWRARFAEARAALARENEALSGVQVRMEEILAELVTAQDDRERVAGLDERRIALAEELTTARNLADAARVVLERLEQEADAAGVPAEWRE